ncbi:MAG: FHIPEP family type III secretion protein [Pirellulaceae bacterium]|jgi:flagellar biosynthesis protein FlhA
MPVARLFAGIWIAGTTWEMGMGSLVHRLREGLLPAALVAALVVVLVPMPTWLIDLLLCGNFALAILILFQTITIRSPLQLSTFPSVLLLATMARLVLNLATTRLILTTSDQAGLESAGKVVRMFGEYVAGDRLEVGLLIFVILFLVQLVVITKGSNRISEVAARFALDGLPGRQMAIDADLAQGTITARQAEQQRADLVRLTEFYGAMDGAGKFIRGDAIASLLILGINLLGGIYVGTRYAQLPLSETFSIFTKLTIGDGLVSQIPALILSIAAALMVTRGSVATPTELSTEATKQVFGSPTVLRWTGLAMLLLLATSLPKFPIAILAASFLATSYWIGRSTRQAAAGEAVAGTPPESTSARHGEEVIQVESLRIQLGSHLLGLADPDRGGMLMPQIGEVRSQMNGQWGILLPMVRVKDRLSLPEDGYEILLDGLPIAQGRVDPLRFLAVPPPGAPRWAGRQATDPATGQPASWIDPADQVQAESQGYQLRDSATVVAMHLKQIAEQYASELLTREAVKGLLDQLKKSHPVLVDELLDGGVKLWQIQQVLRQLLQEGIPIRPLPAILEAIGEAASGMPEDRWLELVRSRLARTISARFCDAEHRLRCVVLSPEVESVLASLQQGAQATMHQDPAWIDRLLQQLRRHATAMADQHLPVVLVVAPRLRSFVRDLVHWEIPPMRVLSYAELAPQTKVLPWDTIRLPSPGSPRTATRAA